MIKPPHFTKTFALRLFPTFNRTLISQLPKVQLLTQVEYVAPKFFRWFSCQTNAVLEGIDYLIRSSLLAKEFV